MFGDGAMPRQKKVRGRPAKPLPPRVDASAEELAERFFRTQSPGPAVDFNKTYQCGACERVVTFPEVLYRDGKCEQCHTTPV